MDDPGAAGRSWRLQDPDDDCTDNSLELAGTSQIAVRIELFIEGQPPLFPHITCGFNSAIGSDGEAFLGMVVPRAQCNGTCLFTESRHIIQLGGSHIIEELETPAECSV